MAVVIMKQSRAKRILLVAI